METILGKVKRLMRRFDGHAVTAKVMSAVLIASSILSPLTPYAATTAYAAPKTITVTESTVNPFGKGNSHFFRVDTGTGGIAYCAQGFLGSPPTGQKLTYYGSLDIPELDYVMYHGYDGVVVTSLYGLDAQRSQNATTLAVWLAIAEQRPDVLSYPEYDGTHPHGNQMYMERFNEMADQPSKEAAWKLYQEALAYKKAGGGGPEEGCAIYWKNSNTTDDGWAWYQGLVTVEKNGDLKLKKVSANPSLTDGNSCYSLEGAEFTVYDASGKSVGKLTTDKSGNSNTLSLPQGTYTVKETKAPEGFFAAADQKVTITPGKTATVTFTDLPASDPMAMLVGKYDGENSYSGIEGNLPQGAASLEGAEFTVEYYQTVDYDSYDDLKASDVSPTRSWVFKTDPDGFAYFDAEYLVSGDAFYYDTTGSPTMPRGTVVVYESKAPAGYNLNTDVSFQKIQEDTLDGVITYNTAEIPEAIYRSDLEFSKKADDSGERLAGVAFSLTSQTTGESHVVVTDENGYFSSASSWNAHTSNTNGNDWALESETPIDSSKLDAAAGIWFGDSDPDDSKGALPYDSYTLKELRCTSNESYQLIETSIIISRDGKVYDFGTLDDITASIQTSAYDPIDGDSNVGVGEIQIADKVTYTNVVAGRDYTLKAELRDAATGDQLTDDNGTPIAVEKTFTAKSSSGSEVVDFTLSTFDMGGSTVVVYEYLYDDGGSLIAEHADKDDVSQQVTVIEPAIHTSAKDGVDGDKTIATDDTVKLVDTVEYTNLVPGREYTLKGTLHVKGTDEDGSVTEEALEVDGKPVTAETTFTPETADGTVDVTFTFDSTALKDGTQIVAFESLEHNGRELAVHADIEDLNQTVTIENPEIRTTALDGIDADKNIVTDDETTIVDTVEYTGLVPGREYTLKGTLHVKGTDEDGSVTEEALEVDGKPVTAETTFTPDKSDGSVNVTFTFDSRNLTEGTALVVFESLVKNGKELAVHADIEDVNQMVLVTVPHIGTTAVDGVDGDKNLVTDDETTIVDTVEYTNLIPGREYTLKGTLHVKGTDDAGNITEEALEVDGKPVTAETTFTPETADGTVDVTFTFDSRSLPEGTQIVAFESLDKNGVSLAVHADIEDEDQTTTVIHPEISTTALDGVDGDKNLVTDDETTIVDTVTYKDLVPGREYTLKGTLQIKRTDDAGNITEEALEVDGKPVTAETTFTPEIADGTVDVTFTFDATGIEDATEIVAFESLLRGDVEIAVHADIEDEDQTTTAHVTSIGTTATDGLDGDKMVIVDAETTITDEVAYENALTGTSYTMAGLLMDANTGLPILTGEGSEKYSDADVAAFMADLLDVLGLSSVNEEGSLDVLVSETSDGDLTTTQSVRIYADGTYEVVTSSQGLDEDGLGTANVDTTGRVSYDALTDDQKEAVKDIVVLADAEIILDYSGLGGLHSIIDTDALNSLLTDNADLVSHLVTQTAEVTPEDYDGTVAMDFGFNANDVIDRLSGETKDIVVFELMVKGTFDASEGSSPVIVAVESDLDNEGQTVTLVPSAISTTATDKSDGDHVLLPGQDAVITDTVSYEGLIPGEEYLLKAVLYDKETAEPLTVNDKQVTAELRFTPNSQTGTVDIDLGPFDASDLNGHDLVVFEELYKQTTGEGETPDDVLVAEHKDIEDKDQTVTVTDSPVGSFFGKTGGDTAYILFAVAALIALAGCTAFFGIKNRRKSDKAEIDETSDHREADGSETPDN